MRGRNAQCERLALDWPVSRVHITSVCAVPTLGNNWPILQGLLNHSLSALAESEGHLDRSVQWYILGYAFIFLGRLMATAYRELTVHGPGQASVIRSSQACAR